MKSAEHVTTNGRAAFYACMWDDLKKAALDCGWALGLHGSLANDMDIMAMPWTAEAVSSGIMVSHLCTCFTEPAKLIKEVRISKSHNNRVIYTIPIWADFYLDINVIEKLEYNEDVVLLSSLISG